VLEAYDFFLDATCCMAAISRDRGCDGSMRKSGSASTLNIVPKSLRQQTGCLEALIVRVRGGSKCRRSPLEVGLLGSSPVAFRKTRTYFCAHVSSQM